MRNIREVNNYFNFFSDLKSNPGSNDKIDDYFNGKQEGGNKFNKGRKGGEENGKFKNNKS